MNSWPQGVFIQVYEQQATEVFIQVFIQVFFWGLFFCVPPYQGRNYEVRPSYSMMVRHVVRASK